MQHTSRFLKIVERVKPHVQEISAEELLNDLTNHKDFILIDVREKEEFQQGHLPCAVNLSKGIIERDIERLIPDENTEIVVYCSGGYRSLLTAYNLKLMGYTHIKSLAEGSRAWMMKGLPVEN